MARKLTPKQQLLTFAGTAEETELREAIDILKILYRARFWKPKPRARTDNPLKGITQKLGGK